MPMNDDTKNWLIREILPLLVVVIGAVLWLTNQFAQVRAEIADVRLDLSEEIAVVRLDLSEEIAAVSERMASVEGKLDLLISGLDIQVRVATGPEQATDTLQESR